MTTLRKIIGIGVILTAMSPIIAPHWDRFDNERYRKKIDDAIIDNSIHNIQSNSRRDTIAIFMTFDERGNRYRNSYIAIQWLKKLRVNDDNIVLYKVPDLYSEESRPEFREFLIKLSSIAGPEDLLIMHLSGHGEYDDQVGSHVGGLASSEFGKVLRYIGSQKIVLVESCGSGGFLDMVDKVDNLTVITSSDHRPSSGNRFTYGNFFFCLFTNLRNNPQISVDDAFYLSFPEFHSGFLKSPLNSDIGTPGIRISQR